MNISPESFFNCILTQVGALDAVMKLNGVKYNHLKPHGQASPSPPPCELR